MFCKRSSWFPEFVYLLQHQWEKKNIKRRDVRELNKSSTNKKKSANFKSELSANKFSFECPLR